jgi:hypothetical protein
MPRSEVDTATVRFFDGQAGAVSEAADPERKLGTAEDVKGAIRVEAGGDKRAAKFQNRRRARDGDSSRFTAV